MAGCQCVFRDELILAATRRHRLMWSSRHCPQSSRYNRSRGTHSVDLAPVPETGTDAISLVTGGHSGPAIVFCACPSDPQMTTMPDDVFQTAPFLTETKRNDIRLCTGEEPFRINSLMFSSTGCRRSLAAISSDLGCVVGYGCERIRRPFFALVFVE